MTPTNHRAPVHHPWSISPSRSNADSGPGSKGMSGGKHAPEALSLATLEVLERLTLVDRFDVCGQVWLLLRPKGSVHGGDLVHGGGTIRVDGEFARALSVYFKEREAAIAKSTPPGDAGSNQGGQP